VERYAVGGAKCGEIEETRVSDSVGGWIGVGAGCQGYVMDPTREREIT
jgi:hypothetical protein